MSTRSVLRVKASSNKGADRYGTLYHHCDGYPTGIGDEILKWHRLFRNEWKFHRPGYMVMALGHVAFHTFNGIAGKQHRDEAFQLEPIGTKHSDTEWEYDLTYYARNDEWILTVFKVCYNTRPFGPRRENRVVDRIVLAPHSLPYSRVFLTYFRNFGELRTSYEDLVKRMQSE